jgi:hypothetical protein
MMLDVQTFRIGDESLLVTVELLKEKEPSDTYLWKFIEVDVNLLVDR